MSAPVVSQQLHAADYSADVVEPALAVIRSLLLQDRPCNVGEYVSQHHSKINAAVSAVSAFAFASGGGGATGNMNWSAAAVHHPPSSVCPTAVAAKRPASPQSQNDGSLAKKSAAQPLIHEESSAAEGSQPPTSTVGGAETKFDTFVMPSGKMEDFHKGVSSRIGFPHLEFEKTMEAEHTRLAGCDMRFTTRNYGITTTANAEWCVVVRGQTPPPAHMLHGRVMVSVEDKLRWINEQFANKGLEVRLRREEVIAVILYTGNNDDSVCVCLFVVRVLLDC
jgi:hypothetical protein